MKKIYSTLFCLLLAFGLSAQDFALKLIEKSPRHHEWVKVKSKDGREVKCFVAFPEKSTKTPAVIVIHENRGLTDWVRSMADQLAEAGYLAIAPDLLSDFSPEIKSTADFASSDDARSGIYELPPDRVTADLNAVESYVSKLPASNGKTAVMGFCWGGAQSFRMATNNKQLKAAMVFYGTAPDKAEDIQRIKAPVYGFYGENDQRVNAGIPVVEKLMKEKGKKYDYVVYESAGHAYMRSGDDPEGSAENKKATQDSWPRIKEILGGL